MPHDLKGKRIIVVGGAGFIGSHIVDLLINEDPEEIVIFDNFTRGERSNIADAVQHDNVTVYEGDITNTAQLDEAFEGIDYAIHQAALWLLTCEENPRRSVDVNIVGTFNVLEACVKHDVKKIVFASSSSVYGEGEYLPTDEDHPFNNDLFYGASKVANEQHGRAFHKKYGLDYVTFRYLNVYGPRQDYHGAYIGVIMHFLNRIDEDESPVIYGDGKATLDMVHVRDVARANIMALKSDLTNVALNVASGEETTLNELADMLLEVTDATHLEPKYKERNENLVVRRWGSAEKAKELLGFETEIPRKQGLREVVEWRAKQLAEDQE